MKRIHALLLCLLTISLSAVVPPVPAQATDWVFPYVVWDDSVYVVTDEAVDAGREQIGEVTSYSDMKRRGGNFSNTFPKGTAYFEIPGTPVSEAIAVQTNEGTFVKAEWESPYEYAQPVRNIGYALIAGLALLAIAAAVYSATRKTEGI